MTNAEHVAAVEQGILRAVGKLITIALLLGVIGMMAYGWYTNLSGSQDRQAQREMNHRLERIR